MVPGVEFAPFMAWVNADDVGIQTGAEARFDDGPAVRVAVRVTIRVTVSVRVRIRVRACLRGGSHVRLPGLPLACQ